jgi:hypothetical protein
MRAFALVACGLLAGCAAAGASRDETVARPPATFDAREFRQPAVFVRVEVRAPNVSERAAAGIPAEFQGLVLEGLNARAVAPRDLTAVPQRLRLDQKAAVARAREVGADHALLVDATVTVTTAAFCRDARRGFTAQTLTVYQHAVVVRASDGSVRWQPDQIETLGIEPDCGSPKDSRVRSTTETMQAAVDRLLARLLGR